MKRYIQKLPARPAAKVDETQGVLSLHVDMQTEFDGIGMGVLSDGTPFLNQRGLARLCGVQNAHIGTISSEWTDSSKPRIQLIKKILGDRNLIVSSPHIPVQHGARTMFAYPDSVCLAVLEYYAFEAGQNIQPEAVSRYRWLAGRSLREVIYDQVGYRKKSHLADTWRQFHDRVSLIYDSVPLGYFCVFKEIADIMITLINAGAPLGSKFVPDISVGIAWSKHWGAMKLDIQFGERQSYEHHYPDYFPQAATNPQMPHCYPEAALPAFRKWMRESYLPESLPAYLKKKVVDGDLPEAVSREAVRAIALKHPKVIDRL